MSATANAFRMVTMSGCPPVQKRDVASGARFLIIRIAARDWPGIAGISVPAVISEPTSRTLSGDVDLDQSYQ